MTSDLALKLIERLENFAGVVDASLDWQFMIEVITVARRVRPGFQLLSGSEYMISAGAIGCAGHFAALAGVMYGTRKIDWSAPRQAEQQ